MIDIFRAEWQKLVGNRWVVGFLIWIFPVGSAGFIAIIALIALLSPTFRENFFMQAPRWTDQFLAPWSFATNLFGRSFLLAFTAITFAGEYQWGTWKNIVPRQRRAWLIVAKLVNLGVLILIAFGLMSLIMGFGQGLLARIAGVAYEPTPVTTAVLTDFGRDYLLQASLTFTLVIITAVYASLSAMLMRSIAGGIMVGLGLTIVEPLIMGVTFALANLFDAPIFLHFARFTPFYSVENINAWVRTNAPAQFLSYPFEQFGQTAPADSITFSLLVLLGWLVVGVALTISLFQRQDITT